MSEIKLWINDREVKAKPNQTILEAADGAGIAIPRLCYHPAVKASGSCRLCAVEIEGYRGLPAACSTPVMEGMRVQTATPKVEEFRRETLRLILQDHPRECVGCPRDGTCELQQLVSSIGIDFPYAPPTEERPPAKPGGAYFERDYSLCVHCGRCVRVCHEVRGAKVIVFREVEGRQEVGTPFDRSLEESGCQFCGACVDVCPVGALREKLDPYQGETRRQMMQVCENLTNIVMNLYRKEMPRSWKSSLCSLCSAGCRMMFEMTEGGDIVQAKGHPMGPSNRGQACVQGRFLLKKYLQSPNRLKKPLLRENGALKETNWDAALDAAAQKFQSYGPGEIAVLTDARATNEELYLLQKFARPVLKTDTIGCITPSGHMAASEVLRKHFGVMAGTGSLANLDQAGCILAIGLNTAATHPIAGTYLRDASLKGTRVVVASPYEVASARYADMHLRYYPGRELALVSGLLRVILDEKHVDPAFAAQYPAELEALKKSLEPYDLETVSKLTGVSSETLVDAACLIGKASTLGILYGLGLIESSQASEALEGLIALSHIRGSLGKPGGGILPLYGNGNLQGAWDMGMLPHLLPGQIGMKDIPVPSDMLEELASGKVKAVYLVLENLEGKSLEFLQPYLEKLEFVVVQDVVSPQIRADVVLPMAAVPEKRGTLTSGERRVQAVEPILSPPGEAKSVQWVLEELAKRMGASGFRYENVEAVMDEIHKQVPAYAGITMDRKAVQWPCPDAQHPGTSVLFADQLPKWVPWKASPPEVSEEPTDKEFPFAAMSKESLRPFFVGPLLAQESLDLFQTNGQIEMNPGDAFGMGFTPGDIIRVVMRTGECEGELVMSRLLSRKMVAVPSKNLQILSGVQDLNGKIFAAKVEKKNS